jgi:hypothetical protein
MPRHNRKSRHRLRPVRTLSKRELGTLPGRAAHHLAEHAARLAVDPAAQTVSGDPDRDWPVFLSVGEDVDRLAAQLVSQRPARLAAVPSLPPADAAGKRSAGAAAREPASATRRPAAAPRFRPGGGGSWAA